MNSEVFPNTYVKRSVINGTKAYWINSRDPIHITYTFLLMDSTLTTCHSYMGLDYNSDLHPFILVECYN